MDFPLDKTNANIEIKDQCQTTGSLENYWVISIPGFRWQLQTINLKILSENV